MGSQAEWSGPNPSVVQITEGWFFGTNQLPVAQVPLQLVDNNSHRTSLVICNLGATTVFLGNSAQVSSGTGHGLPSGSSIALNTKAAVYAVSDTGTNTLSYLEEMQ